MPNSLPGQSIEGWLGDVAGGLFASPRRLQIEVEALWALLDKLPAAVLISTEAFCGRIFGNLAAHEMLGAPLGSNMSQTAAANERPDFTVLQDGVEIPVHELPMQSAARTGLPTSRFGYEVRWPDGRRIFLNARCVPIRLSDGRIGGALGVFTDVTEQKKRDERNDIETREMTHRIVNTVSLIQAIASATIRQKLSPLAWTDFEQRLRALARAQTTVGHVPTSVDTLNEVIAQATLGIVEHGRDRITAHGCEVSLTHHQRSSIGLIVHELATNAVKHGSLSQQGHVLVDWSLHPRAEAQALVFGWREFGGPPCVAPSREGFGTKLISRLCRGLNVTRLDLRYPPEGLHCEFEFHLRRLAGAGPRDARKPSCSAGGMRRPRAVPRQRPGSSAARAM